jgi:hypothetical protein
MAALAQLFAGTHDDALTRADALAAGHTPPAAPHVDVPSLTPLDLETLGEVAARVVRFGTGDLEPAEIDLDHETLFALPEFWCEVIAELATTEEPDALTDVAEAWAATDAVSIPGDLHPVVRDVVGLVTQAERAGLDVFLWVEEL